MIKNFLKNSEYFVGIQWLGQTKIACSQIRIHQQISIVKPKEENFVADAIIQRVLLSDISSTTKPNLTSQQKQEK